MAEQRKKPLMPPLTAQVNEIDLESLTWTDFLYEKHSTAKN